MRVKRCHFRQFPRNPSVHVQAVNAVTTPGTATRPRKNRRLNVLMYPRQATSVAPSVHANGLKRGRYAPSALQNYRLTLPPLVRLHAPGAGCGQCQQAHDGWGERPIASGQFGRLSGAAQRKA